MTFLKYLKEQNLLLEKDHRKKIINNVGLTPEVADELHNWNDKYSIWLANQIKDDIEKWNRQEENPENYILGVGPFIEPEYYDSIYDYVVKKDKNPANATTLTNTLKIILRAPEVQEALTGIIDWITSQHGQVNIKNYSFEQAVQAQEEWHQQEGKTAKLLSSTGGIRIKNASEGPDYKDQKLLLKFPDNWFWLDLGTDEERNYSEEESVLMSRKSDNPQAGHHCGRDERGTALFSLRDGNDYIEVAGVDGNAPHLTISVYPNGDGSLTYTQFKGIGNSKPKEIYFDKIVDLFIKMNINNLDETSYKSESNFHVQDLNDEQFKRLMDNIPSILQIPGALIKAYQLDLVGIEEIKEATKNIENLNLDANKAVLFYPETDLSDLSNLLLDYNMVFFTLGDNLEKNPGNFYKIADFADMLPDAFNKAVMYIYKKYTDNRGELEEDDVEEIIDKLYPVNPLVKELIHTAAEIIFSWNTPELFLLFEDEFDQVDLDFETDEEFYKLIFSTDDFLEVLKRVMTGAETPVDFSDLTSELNSYAGRTAAIDESYRLDEINLYIEEAVERILKDYFESREKEREDSQQQYFDFYKDYKPDFTKRFKDIMQGYYEQRRHRRRPRYDVC